MIPSITLAVLCFLFAFAHETEIVDGGWVDPDTPGHARTTRAHTRGDNRKYELVFSDEFEEDGRTFHDGNDPRWTAIHKNDYTNAALHFYSHDNAATSDGMLKIVTERKTNHYKAFDEDTKSFYADKKYVQTGMLQGWNKFCFIGGVVEFSARLPGDPRVGGLWPALWMLGNLARATFVGSSDYMWPFSYNQCDEEHRYGQEISACKKINHYGLFPFQGRGAPEIDVIESMQGEAGKLPSTHIQRPYQSASYQVAPGIDSHRPELGSRPMKGHWYTHLEYGNETKSDLNPFFYGVTLVHKPRDYTYQSDALSANMQLNNTHYNEQHIYRVEWEPPDEDGSGGYIRWYTDDKFVYGVVGESLSMMQTEIPSEPMYLIMNTAVSSHWGFPAPCPSECECECFECGNRYCECGMPDGYCDNFPATFEIDYVRVYHAVDEPKHILGCSPPHKPTDLFIQGHSKRYMEDGQKQPLEPVAHGGRACSHHSDCGGSHRGRCSSRSGCICYTNTTGPNCLAHFGFHDLQVDEEVDVFEVSTIILPLSLVVAIAALFCGFLVSMIYTLRSRWNYRHNYREIPAPPTQEPSSDYYSNQRPSYQYQQTSPIMASASYVLPPKPNNATYIVIDERMLESPTSRPSELLSPGEMLSPIKL